MLKVLIVGLGGFVGSAGRYLVSGWVHRFVDAPWYPLGTLTVNVLGCLVIGVIGGLVENRELFSPDVRLFLTIGLLGGFTTFSTFGYETLALLRDAQWTAALSYVVLHVILGIGAALLGYSISHVV